MICLSHNATSYGEQDAQLGDPNTYPPREGIGGVEHIIVKLDHYHLKPAIDNQQSPGVLSQACRGVKELTPGQNGCSQEQCQTHIDRHREPRAEATCVVIPESDKGVIRKRKVRKED